jgi:hypothetical protein
MRIASCNASKNAHICAHQRAVAMAYETNTAKIIARLLKEGWENVGGTKHAKFRKPGHSSIMVSRHRTVTSGVAKAIAKAAGWA